MINFELTVTDDQLAVFLHHVSMLGKGNVTGDSREILGLGQLIPDGLAVGP